MNSKSGPLSSALFFLTLLSGLNGEIFSSTALLSETITEEREIVRQLQTYVEFTETKISRLRNFIDAFNRVLYPTDVDEVINNPLAAYQLIKQLKDNWAGVENLLTESWSQDLIQQILSSNSSYLMPQLNDVQGAALAILRLQETYRLNASDLARGNILGIQSSFKLTIEDCIYFGHTGFDHELFDLAVEWYGLALLLSGNESNPVVSPQKITKYLNEALKKNNAAPPSTNYVLGVDITDEESDINYNALCRGEQLMSNSELASLNCYLSDRGDASFYINPIKVEVHSHDPLIVTFHDIIYESEINLIKEISQPYLKRSKTYGDNSSIVSNDRTSQNTWVHDDEEDEQLRRKVEIIMNRASRITGLNVHGKNNSESLQVANYGIGGHYSTHEDFLYIDGTPEETARYFPSYKIIGDRLATLMFYLSDVKLGGATVFPLIGAAAWPRKGSAVFWYNLRRSGEPDPLTLHGGCPVLHGSKWIGNKWIREVNQVFKRPCSLDLEDE